MRMIKAQAAIMAEMDVLTSDMPDMECAAAYEKVISMLTDRAWDLWLKKGVVASNFR